MDNHFIATFETLSQSFLKIIKINLSTQEAEIIKDYSEDFCDSCDYHKNRNNEKGNSSDKVLRCMHCIAENNQVHISDKEAYLKHTDLEYLRTFFQTHDEPWRLRYRRKRGNAYKWVMMEIIKANDYSDENQSVIISVKDVDQDLSNIFEHEQKLLDSLKTERMCMAIVHDLISSGVWRIIYDDDGKANVFWSQEFRHMIGYKDETDFPNELNSWLDLIHPLDIERVKKEFFDVLNDSSGTQIYDAQYRLLTKDRGYRWFRDAGEVSRKPDGTPFIYLGIFIDITESKEKEILNTEIQRKKRIEQKQLNLIKSIASIYYTLHVIDLRNDTVTEFSSNDLIRQYVNSSENASGQLRLAMENTVDSRYIPKALEFTNLKTLKERIGSKTSISAEFIGKNIGWFEACFIVAERNPVGEIYTVIFTTRSIDKEKRREENLLLISNTDELTGLYNRHAYDGDIQKLEGSTLSDDLVVISMDSNGLKTINDSLGHAAGDEMLKGTAECIKRHFKYIGRCYRMGGDEFTVIARIAKENIEEIYNDFLESLSNWRGRYIAAGLSVSFGYAYAGDNQGLDVEELAKIADKNMYKDKAAYYVRTGKDRRKR